MLVGFSGAAGSGKTTLVDLVAQKLRDHGYSVGVVREVAREVFKEFEERYGVKSLNELRSTELYLDFQIRILREQVSAEDRLLREHDIVLCDRTIYDNLMYTLIWCSGSAALETYRFVFEQCAKNRKYTIIFLCEPINDDVDDGFRTPDIDYRELQEWLLKLLLPNYSYLPVMPIEQRVSLVRKTIEILYEIERGDSKCHVRS